MKKFLFSIIMIISLIGGQTVVNADDTVKVVVDGNNVEFADQAPVIIEGRTLVPIRAVMEALGKEVGWDSQNSMVTVNDQYITLKLGVGRNIMQNAVKDPVTGEVFEYETELDVAPTIINDRTCLPIRAVVEAFGIAVTWDEATRSVLIVSSSLLC